MTTTTRPPGPPFDLFTYRARYLANYDGDTITLYLDLGLHQYAELRIRLLNVDTPELRGPERPDGLIAKDRVEDWFKRANTRALYAGDDWPIRVATAKTGKYGRWLGDIYTFDGQHLNAALIAEGWEYDR